MAGDALREEWEALLAKTEHLYIYGAGKVGRKILRLITSSGALDRVRGFVTTLPPPPGGAVADGLPVIGLDSLSDTDAAIFVAVTDAWQEEIRRELGNRGFKNYTIVYKYSFLDGDDGGAVGIPQVATVGIRELLAQQFRDDGEFNRLDVIVRVLAVESFYGRNDSGMALYAKMQTLRNPDANGGSYGDLAVPRFENLIRSIAERGYDPSSEIIVDRRLRLVDGAHRLSLAIYNDVKLVRMRMLDEERPEITYGREWFAPRFTKNELTAVENKFRALSEAWSVPIAGIIWPPAMPFADEIIKRIREKYTVADVRTHRLPDEVFKQFVRGVYHIDSIADWKVDYKIKEFAPYADKTFATLDIHMPRPDFRIKEAGTPVSRAGEALKKEIRDGFKGRIKDYHPDVIFHTGDDFHQSDYIRGLLAVDFPLRPFFKSIDRYKWMLIKLESDYLPESFPDSVPLFKDIDIIVASENFEIVTDAAESFFRNICGRFPGLNLKVRRTKPREGNVHVRLELGGFLLFLADCYSRIPNLSNLYLKESLSRRQTQDCYWVPDELDECVFRLAEFESYPEKTRHQDYVQRWLERTPGRKGELEERCCSAGITGASDEMIRMMDSQEEKGNHQ